MLVIAIVAATIIVAPVWQRHLIRGRVADAITSTDAAKLVVIEAAVVHHGLTGVKAAELGYNPATAVNPHVASIKISDGGHIILTTRNTGAEPNLIVVLTPKEAKGKSGAASISWRCSVASGETSYLPASCLGSSVTPPENR